MQRMVSEEMMSYASLAAAIAATVLREGSTCRCKLCCVLTHLLPQDEH